MDMVILCKIIMNDVLLALWFKRIMQLDLTVIDYFAKGTFIFIYLFIVLGKATLG